MVAVWVGVGVVVGEMVAVWVGVDVVVGENRKVAVGDGVKAKVVGIMVTVRVGLVVGV